MYSAEYGLEMPDSFPVEELTRFMAAARHVLLNPEMSSEWGEFAGASNLIGWRFRASSDDWQTYKRSIAESPAKNHEELYQRERALFGMFVSGVSCIESVAYALAVLFSHPALLSLPFGKDKRRLCGPRELADWLDPYPTAERLSQALACLVASQEWAFWVKLRNRMTHRSDLPRVIHLSAGAPLPLTKPLDFAETSSTPRIEADVSMFDSLHAWLARTVGQLLAEGADLASKR